MDKGFGKIKRRRKKYGEEEEKYTKVERRAVTGISGKNFGSLSVSGITDKGSYNGVVNSRPLRF